MLGLSIREMVFDDVYRGFMETLSSLAPVSLTPVEAIRVFQLRAANVCMRTFVAIMEGRVVGTASLLIERKYLHKGSLSAHIEDVAIHTSMQGRGVGRALIKHATDCAKELGCYKVILDCGDNLIPFYEKSGFYLNCNCMRMDLVKSEQE